MTDVDTILAGRAADLRHAFDRSFAEPLQADARETVDFVAIRLGGDAHAVRMAQISGLFTGVKVSPCPSPIPEFRGLAGFRGVLTPVYDLAALVGYPSSSARWLVVASGGSLALAFDAFDGHFRIERTAVAADQETVPGRHVREIARQADAAWPVIDIPSIVAAIRKRLPQSAQARSD